MKKTRYLISLLYVLGATAAGAANISKSDPSPNVYDPDTYAPLDGGVGYHWTVVMGPKDRANLEGTVGAWSWDEDFFPETARGWTHTSNWIALKLTKASKVTIRLSRKANVPIDGGGTGGGILYPAFTLYRNWDGDGGDSHTYNNRGDVEWAEDLSYIAHVENKVTGAPAQLTLELPAGLYSIALGGSSPSVDREPVQGYGASIVTMPIEQPEIRLRRSYRSTSRESEGLSGMVTRVDKVRRILVVQNGKRHAVSLRRNGWSTRISRLEPGRNVVWLMLESKEGKIVDRKRVVIVRRVPRTKPSVLHGLLAWLQS